MVLRGGMGKGPLNGAPAKLFSGITENKNLTQTEGVLGLRTVEKRGILLEDLTYYNNE